MFQAKARLLKFVKNLITGRMERTNKDGIMDVIDVLLNETSKESEHKLSTDFICGNIVEMMVPGDESVPAVMTIAVKYLSDHPLVLKQLLVNTYKDGSFLQLFGIFFFGTKLRFDKLVLCCFIFVGREYGVERKEKLLGRTLYMDGLCVFIIYPEC